MSVFLIDAEVNPCLCWPLDYSGNSTGKSTGKFISLPLALSTGTFLVDFLVDFPVDFTHYNNNIRMKTRVGTVEWPHSDDTFASSV